MGTRRSLRVTKKVVAETVTTEDESETEDWPIPSKNKRTKLGNNSSKLKERNDTETDNIPIVRKSGRKPVPKKEADYDTDYEDEELTGDTDTEDDDGDEQFSVPTDGRGVGKNKGPLRRPLAIRGKNKKKKLKGRSNQKEVFIRPPTQRRSSAKTDFSTTATAFIASKSNSNPSSFWCRPTPVAQDPLVSVVQNGLGQIGSEEDIKEYLPSLKESVAFKTIVESDELNKKPKAKDSEFRKLAWFEGKLVDTLVGNLVYNAGGPILGLGWHPNGKHLAISTANHPSENIDYKLRTERKSFIQIYQHYYKAGTGKVTPEHYLAPQLFICVDYGYATHVQWCNFCPDCWDTDTTTFLSDDKYERVGHLACSFEDGTVRIFSLRVSDLLMIGTFSPLNDSKMIPVYKKSAEMCFRIDSSVYPNAGQVCRFEWHEDNKLLAVAYYSGVVAIFDVQTTSPLLAENVVKDSHYITRVVNPFWCFQAHLGPINGLSFDPMSPRFFVTGSKDRNLKLWDLNLRQEIECRKIGLIQDICWIRGWINVAVAVDAAISNLSSQYNFVRFYQIGTSQPRPNCAEFMDISSLSFYEGLTIQGTERGNVTCTYFDNFWREMDYDRNKKKHNVVNILKTDLDPKSFDELSQTDFAGVTGPRKLFHFEDEAPRVILTFLKERVKTVLPDPKPQFFENYIRFLPYLRINKVSWCPIGGCFATGYRSGLLTIIPAGFQSLYG